MVDARVTEEDRPVVATCFAGCIGKSSTQPVAVVAPGYAAAVNKTQPKRQCLDSYKEGN